MAKEVVALALIPDNNSSWSVQRINEIVRGKRSVTPETAWLFSQALGTTPEFWLNLQTAHDLAKTRPKRTVPALVSAAL